MDAPLKMQVLGRVCRDIYRYARTKRLIRGSKFVVCKNIEYDSGMLISRRITTTANLKTVSEPEEAVNIRRAFRCHDNNPLNHNIDQEGLFYSVHEDEYKKLLQNGINAEFQLQSKTFAESCIMVRKPALEMINYLKHVNLNRPVTRAVFYGHHGCGKTMSLSHVLHYCSKDNWLIVHVPWTAKWTRSYHEISVSSFKPGRIDLPVDGAEWLSHFRTQNFDLLAELICSKKYTWSKREHVDEGTPLLDIVDFGLNRQMYSSDCIGILLKEIKKQAIEKKIKVLVAVDGVNGLFTRSTLKTEDREEVLTENISLVRSFRKMLFTNWSNGFVMCTVDSNANYKTSREDYTPNYLLGKVGFEAMDPFIPVLVPKYTDKEIHSCLEYYADRNWLQHSQGKTAKGLQEIIFLSNHNPYTLARVCASR